MARRRSTTTKSSDAAAKPDPVSTEAKAPEEPEKKETEKSGRSSDLPKGTEKKTWIVSETPPAKVAGRRVKPGQTIELTGEEARSEYLFGHISPVVED